MVATPLTDLARRLLANVDADRGDLADVDDEDPGRAVPRSRRGSSARSRPCSGATR